MTRETKVGLLVGMGVILLIGIIISDHLSQVQKQDAADLGGFAERAQQSIADVEPVTSIASRSTPTDRSAIAAAGASRTTSVLQRMQTVPTPQEMQESTWQAAENTSAAVEPVQGRELPQAYRLDESAVAGAQRNSEAADVERLTLSHRSGADALPSVLSLEDASVIQPRVVEAGPSRPTSTTVLPDAAEAQRGGGAPIIHYVQPGETLYQIAQKYYGNGEYWRTIAAHNADRVKPNGQVNQNVRLVVPNRAGLAALGDDFMPAGYELQRRLTPAVRPDPPKTITVEPGDTLTELASRHLGSASRWEELFEANKDKLDRPESLRAGMELVLPRDDESSARAQATPIRPAPLRVLATPLPPSEVETPAIRPVQAKTYTVKPGDSLYRIAAETLGDGKRWREVFEANRDKLKDPNAVVVGQSLVIPR